MNERIKELAVKSGGFRDDGGKLISRFIENTDMTDEIQEFAELIVRECATIAKTAEPWRSDDLILKHFGLKDN